MSAKNQKRVLTLAIPEMTSYYQWKWLEKSSKRLLLESKRKFVFRNACMENALIFRPTTLQTLEMQILHYNRNDDCTHIEVFEAPINGSVTIAAPNNITLNSPEASTPADSNSSSTEAVIEEIIRSARADMPSTSNCLEEDSDCSLDVEVGDDADDISYNWEWQPRDDSILKTYSTQKFKEVVLCIEDALRNKPKEYETDLCLQTLLRDICINSELLPEDDKRLETQRVLLDVDVTVKTGSRTVTAGNTRMRATYYRGNPRIDIRRWKKIKDGRVIPTKKGVALPPQRWQRLISERERVSKLLERVISGENIKESIHIGGPLYCQLQYPFWTVQLREMYLHKKSGELKHTRKGIILSSREWYYITGSDKEILEKIPEVSDASPCYLRDDHNNQVRNISIHLFSKTFSYVSFQYIYSQNIQLRIISIH